MYKKCLKLIVCCFVACMVLTQAHLTCFAAASASSQERLCGSDRYKTAIAISQSGWQTSKYAVLARGDDYADALCAGPLAQKYGAPILLTETGALNNDTLVELKRLGVESVFIVGGYGAVSSNIETTLTASGIKFDRISGDDRYGTSVKIAERIGVTDKVALVTGLDFPDALSISAIASKLMMPILLTEKDVLPGAVNQFISDKKILHTYIVGGTGVISSSLESILPGGVRLGGKDRFETNTLVMENFKADLNFLNIYVATGNNFADALSGAVLAAQKSSPVVLTDNALPSVTESFLASKVSLGTKVIALGGASIVPGQVVDNIAALVNKLDVKVVYDKAGTYGPASGTQTISGNVVISVRDVILQNTIIEGNLLLAEGIGDGDATLNGVTVKGTTIIRGGGSHSDSLINCQLGNTTMDTPFNTRLFAQGSTSVGAVSICSSAKLEGDEPGVRFSSAEINSSSVIVQLYQAFFGRVGVSGFSSLVDVMQSTIDSFQVNPGAGSTTIVNNGTINNFLANASVAVTGKGSIDSAVVTTPSVSIDQNPNSTTIEKGAGSAVIGGKVVNETPVVSDVIYNPHAQTLWVKLTSAPTKRLIDTDFRITMQINGGTITSFLGILYPWDAVKKAVEISIPYVSLTDIDQSVVYSVDYKGTSVKSTKPYIMQAYRPLKDYDILGENGATTINTDKGTLQMETNLNPINATDIYMTDWSVTPGTGTATIDSKGKLTALTNGTVTVNATVNYQLHADLTNGFINTSSSKNKLITITNQLNRDATLKTSSKIKGQPVTDLGAPNKALDSVTPGKVTITKSKASDISNSGELGTLFQATDANARITKVVKYASTASTAAFETDKAYANEAINNNDFFMIKVAAQDGSVLYYKINVAVVEDPVAVSTVSATNNGYVTVLMTKTPVTTPVAGDFTVTQQINGGIPTPVSVSSIAWVAGENTGRLFIPVVSATTIDQSVVITVSYKDTAAKSASAFVVNAIIWYPPIPNPQQQQQQQG